MGLHVKRKSGVMHPVVCSSGSDLRFLTPPQVFTKDWHVDRGGVLKGRKVFKDQTM